VGRYETKAAERRPRDSFYRWVGASTAGTSFGELRRGGSPKLALRCSLLLYLSLATVSSKRFSFERPLPHILWDALWSRSVWFRVDVSEKVFFVPIFAWAAEEVCANANKLNRAKSSLSVLSEFRRATVGESSPATSDLEVCLGVERRGGGGGGGGRASSIVNKLYKKAL
jgi:hypothetical protein